MKKIFTLMAAFALTMVANAQEMYASFDDGEKVVSVNLKNEATVTSLSFKFALPDGVTVVTETEGDETYELWEFDADRVKDSRTKKWSTDIRPTADGKGVMVTCYGGPGITAGDGPIFHIPVQGELKGDVTFYNAQVYIGQEIPLSDFAYSFGTAINSIKAEETKSGVIYNLNGQRVSKATKGVYVIDGKKYAVK